MSLIREMRIWMEKILDSIQMGGTHSSDTNQYLVI